MLQRRNRVLRRPGIIVQTKRFVLLCKEILSDEEIDEQEQYKCNRCGPVAEPVGKSTSYHYKDGKEDHEAGSRRQLECRIVFENAQYQHRCKDEQLNHDE